MFIDTQPNALLGQIPLSGHPESFQLERKGIRIFVNVPSTGKIEVVDREKQQVVGAWTVAARGNFPMALDEEHARLFIGTRSPAKFLVLEIPAPGAWSRNSTASETRTTSSTTLTLTKFTFPAARGGYSSSNKPIPTSIL